MGCLYLFGTFFSTLIKSIKFLHRRRWACFQKSSKTLYLLDDIAKDAYNFFLSQLRIRVEMPFGLLVRKWGILQQKLGCSLNTNSDILVACGRLHNYVLANNDIYIELVLPNLNIKLEQALEPNAQNVSNS